MFNGRAMRIPSTSASKPVFDASEWVIDYDVEDISAFDPFVFAKKIVFPGTIIDVWQRGQKIITNTKRVKMATPLR